MDSTIAKSESQWWARKEILHLREELANREKQIIILQDENRSLSAGQCCEKNGLSADEGGVIFCKQVVWREQESNEHELIIESYEALVPHLRKQIVMLREVAHTQGISISQCSSQ